MRFMMLMIPKGYETAAPGTMPDPKAVEAMMRYNEALQKAGVLVALDGLHPPSMGARVSFKGGKPTVTDGPFAEAKEVLGGYWMIQVKSRQEAIEWASRWTDSRGSYFSKPCRSRREKPLDRGASRLALRYFALVYVLSIMRFHLPSAPSESMVNEYEAGESFLMTTRIFIFLPPIRPSLL